MADVYCPNCKRFVAAGEVIRARCGKCNTTFVPAQIIETVRR